MPAPLEMKKWGMRRCCLFVWWFEGRRCRRWRHRLRGWTFGFCLRLYLLFGDYRPGRSAAWRHISHKIITSAMPLLTWFGWIFDAFSKTSSPENALNLNGRYGPMERLCPSWSGENAVLNHCGAFLRLWYCFEHDRHFFDYLNSFVIVFWIWNSPWGCLCCCFSQFEFSYHQHFLKCFSCFLLLFCLWGVLCGGYSR